MRTTVIALCLLGSGLGATQIALAQTRTPTDAECQVMRQRLADHAQLSEGVRRAVASQVAALPATPAGPAPAATAPAPAQAASRADTIRARLGQIPAERQALETQRLGAMVKFDLAGAGQIQSKIQALDGEKAALEQELASLPASAPSVPAQPAAPTRPVETVAAAPQPGGDAFRVRCQDVQASLDAAVKIRQRELGGREGQAGVVPLVTLKGQSSEQIAEELAAQLGPGAAGSATVGLLDTEGDLRLDGVVDQPAPGVFRLVRRRSDGTLSVDVFSKPGGGAAYGEISRKLDETSARQTGQTLEMIVATRPAGPVRTLAETWQFGRAHASMLAGQFAEAGQLEGPAARSQEFQNFRGEAVRTIEILSPVTEGVSGRRLVALARSQDSELWEETTTIVRLPSYWRTDVEVSRAQESRTPAGAMVGTRSTGGPFKFSLER